MNYNSDHGAHKKTLVLSLTVFFTSIRFTKKNQYASVILYAMPHTKMTKFGEHVRITDPIMKMTALTMIDVLLPM